VTKHPIYPSVNADDLHRHAISVTEHSFYTLRRKNPKTVALASASASGVGRVLKEKVKTEDAAKGRTGTQPRKKKTRKETDFLGASLDKTLEGETEEEETEETKEEKRRRVARRRGEEEEETRRRERQKMARGKRQGGEREEETYRRISRHLRQTPRRAWWWYDVLSTVDG
jgi:hypothetical protein